MAKQYAIPTDVVFTFDDEPVDIQEMLHDNAESEEVVEGLERLLKAVAAPGFTEAEVVFDIGGGISVVRAARRTANPRKAGVFVLQETRGHGSRTWQAYGEATVATVDGYKVAYQSRFFSDEHGQAGMAIPLNKAFCYYALKPDGTPDPERYARQQGSRGGGWLVDTPYDSVKVGSRKEALAYLTMYGRTDNPGDDGQQSLPLDGGRTGNPDSDYSKAAYAFLQAVRSRRDSYEGTHDPAFWAAYNLLVPQGQGDLPDDQRILYRFAMDFDYYEPWSNDRNIKILTGHSRGFWERLRRQPNPRGGGLVSGYGINTFAMDPDDYAPERVSNPHEAVATMLGRPRR